jgi:hypothetical protein
MNRQLNTILQHQSSERGSVLPMVMGMGMIMMLAGVILIVQSQQGQNLAQGRTVSGNSLAVAEGGVARTLALLTKPNNAVLLTRNYDEINAETGRTHLGPDGIVNSGDEESTIVQEWANACPCPPDPGPPDIAYSGNIGSNGQYKLLAYRYNAIDKTGTFLVEGTQGNSAAAHITVTVSINSSVTNFPGIVGTDSVKLLGRNVSGVNGNVYYDPNYGRTPSSITGFAAPNSPNRAQYLDDLWSGPSDNVSGTIFAYPLNFTLPYTPPSEALNLGDIKNSRTIINTTGTLQNYKAKKIELNNNDTLLVDTTQGSVHLYVKEGITMRDRAKIRNVRSDGKPPRVGDLRLILGEEDFREVSLYDTPCIDTAFIYDAKSDVLLKTDGDGCPSKGNSNIDGVVWAEDIDETTNASTSGINVPDDVSSLSDILPSIGLTVQSNNKFGSIKSWQKVKL